MFKDQMHSHEKKFYGVGTVGEKGQIVIPAEAREALNIKTGDKFVFFGMGRRPEGSARRAQVLHMIETEKLNDFLEKMTSFSSKIDEFKKSVREKINKAD